MSACLVVLIVGRKEQDIFNLALDKCARMPCALMSSL